jgi:hypothetical protein
MDEYGREDIGKGKKEGREMKRKEGGGGEGDNTNHS